jgi:hypothetical protein
MRGTARASSHGTRRLGPKPGLSWGMQALKSELAEKTAVTDERALDGRRGLNCRLIQ